MPWSMQNPPPPAKNWSVEKKRRCISAANAALRDGKSEQDAIYACIGAAKTVKQKARMRVSDAQVELYNEEQSRVEEEFHSYARAYLDGQISLEDFERSMREGLKQYYIRIALIAKGQNSFRERDRQDVARFLAMIYGYLDGFILDLREYGQKVLASDQGVIHRAGTYGYGWGVFSRFTIPGELADLLPSLPGLSCLGGEACGCFLEFDSDEDGYYVYWYVNLFKQNCIICLDHAAEWSPLFISREEIVAEYGEEVLDENGEFVEF